MLNYFPKWISNKSMQLFFFVLILTNVVWSQYALSVSYILVSSISVILFFYGTNVLTKKWVVYSPSVFLRKLYQIGLTVRLIWCIFIYFFNIDHYGSPIGSLEDTEFYMSIAKECAEHLTNGSVAFLDVWFNNYDVALDDIGYPIFLGLQYLITFNISDIVIPFIFKSILGAYSCVLIYKVARRHFGEPVGRIAGIMCVFYMPIIYWCGSMMKEAEMMFLCCWFIERIDSVFFYRTINIKSLIIASLIGLFLFLFRSALGIAAFGAVFISILLSSEKYIKKTNKIVISFCIAIILFLGIGNKIVSEFSGMYDKVVGGAQQENMEWRAQRKGGNEFAKYAGAAVFAPLIVTIPFPTLIEANSDQVIQAQLSGGYFIKNVTSFFVIFVLFSLLFNKEWRKHTLIIFYLLAYLAVLVLSGYAQSGRFHAPVLPFEILFAAYGIAIFPRNKRHWFNYALIFEFVVCIAWNWFKLKGRGMI